MQEPETDQESVKDELSRLAVKKGYGSSARHIFLCTGDKCSSSQINAVLWQKLKEKIHQVQNENPDTALLRAKTDCLRICEGGPLALVYPDGTFYHALNEQKIERIVDEHLVGGCPVSEYSFFTQQLKS
ncbi:MAG: NAD(P)H-dependent oxidoreductase subunit E [Leptospiraceae bacterium]|nr:NAD(P)H-dependent oxidoreductase subunit E [Leptospiraceae bacterium]